MKTPTPSLVWMAVLAATLAAAAPSGSILKYGDETADGKKSLGGSGELIRFTNPAGPGQVTGLRIHGSRYGNPEAPNESFLIHFLNEDRSEVLCTEMAPYRLFERGPERWVEVTFQKPRPVPGAFWVALDFRAHRTKGVYVSYDTSTGGKESKTGLPGLEATEVDFGGDWLVQVRLAR